MWNILHLGGPDHPMHIHMTEFQMISRQEWPVSRSGGTVPEFDLTTGATRNPLPAATPGRPIDAVTQGMKDTWVVKGGPPAPRVGLLHRRWCCPMDRRTASAVECILRYGDSVVTADIVTCNRSGVTVVSEGSHGGASRRLR